MIQARTRAQLSVIVLVIVAIWLNKPALETILTQSIPIRYVQVEGAFQYIEKEDIKNKIDPLVQSSYFSVDLQLIKHTVMSLPWARNVQVQRLWPDRLKLKIFEQRPVVRWQEEGLLNLHGDIFRPLNMDEFQTLPTLYAPMDQRYQFLQIMEGLALGLKDQGLHLAEFRVSERQSWLLVMENGLIIQLGRSEPLQKFTLLMQTLMVSGTELVEKMAYIDMRYPNGYAVRWRNDEQIIW